jgi:sortase A
VPIAVDLSDQAVEQDPIPQPFRGDPLLRLEIPRIGRDDIVVPGVTLNDLKSGPGHYPETPLPGQLGNAAIAGHRTTYGAPFINVDRLQPGDEIIATLLNGDRFVYEVTFVEVVEASDYRVVTTSDPNIAELTLTSCHPKYTAQKRIVVHSVLNPDKSSNVGFPTFYQLEPEPEPAEITADDPVLDADDIEITGPSSALGELDEASAEVTADQPEGTGDEAVDGVDDEVSSEGSTEASTDEPAAGVVDDEPSDDGQLITPADEPIDAFSQGWFGDRDAFPQIALWGMALTIISLLSYQVSKKFRHDSIGFLVGILPFLFALYFFFQNVNRLLPPGI